MTPFAQRILNDACNTKSKRKFEANGCPFDVAATIAKGHSFECSEILEAADQLRWSMAERADRLIGTARLEQLMFLPDHVTWIEFEQPGQKLRAAYLLFDHTVVKELSLSKNPIEGRVGCLYCQELPDNIFGCYFLGVIGVTPDTFFQYYLKMPLGLSTEPSVDKMAALCISGIYPLLALINTPRIIGRKQFMPHAGLQRKLAAARGMVGKFPLRAWTEIKLDIVPQIVDDAVHETHLTGSKALHFVRQHLRIRLGRVEIVSPHWRGDPALGIVRSRYRLEDAA